MPKLIIPQRYDTAYLPNILTDSQFILATLTNNFRYFGKNSFGTKLSAAGFAW